MIEVSLTELVTKFDTDKGRRHGYMEIYDLLFGTPARLLELGVHRGASLALWKAAFPGCDVHGVDIRSVAVDGATVWVGDAYTHEMAADLPGPFDVIVDDGPHTLQSMLFVAAHYTPLLSAGGLLVIEDIPDPQWVPLIAAAVPDDLMRGSFAVDRRHVAAADSLMFVVKKPTEGD